MNAAVSKIDKATIAAITQMMLEMMDFFDIGSLISKLERYKFLASLRIRILRVDHTNCYSFSLVIFISQSD